MQQSKFYQVVIFSFLLALSFGNYVCLKFACIPTKKGDWATPSCGARLGQPVGQTKQASDLIPGDKNSVNSKGEIPLLELLHSKEQLFLT